MASYRHIDVRYTGGVKMLGEHAKGRACDINQEKRNVVSVRQPKNVSDVAHKCGLFSGAEWASTPDRGYFEVLDGAAAREFAELVSDTAPTAIGEPPRRLNLLPLALLLAPLKRRGG